MEDVDFEGDNEGDRVFPETMNEIDDIEYANLPMDSFLLILEFLKGVIS